MDSVGGKSVVAPSISSIHVFSHCINVLVSQLTLKSLYLPFLTLTIDIGSSPKQIGAILITHDTQINQNHVILFCQKCASSNGVSLTIITAKEGKKYIVYYKTVVNKLILLVHMYAFNDIIFSIIHNNTIIVSYQVTIYVPQMGKVSLS